MGGSGICPVRHTCSADTPAWLGGTPGPYLMSSGAAGDADGGDWFGGGGGRRGSRPVGGTGEAKGPAGLTVACSRGSALGRIGGATTVGFERGGASWRRGSAVVGTGGGCVTAAGTVGWYDGATSVGWYDGATSVGWCDGATSVGG